MKRTNDKQKTTIQREKGFDLTRAIAPRSWLARQDRGARGGKVAAHVDVHALVALALWAAWLLAWVLTARGAALLAG